MSNQKFFLEKKLMKKSFLDLSEELSIVKLKKLKIVSDDEFDQFLRAMKKMNSDKEITRKEKDMISRLFKKLVAIIISDSTLVQKIARRTDDEKENS